MSESSEFDFGQLYGYTVCLLAILTFLVSFGGLVGGVLDLREPPYTEVYRDGPTLVSLGAYKADILSRGGFSDLGEAGESLVPSDSVFARMYDAERLYRLALTHQVSRRTIAVHAGLLAVAVFLFGFHWQWLRRRERRRYAEAP